MYKILWLWVAIGPMWRLAISMAITCMLLSLHAGTLTDDQQFPVIAAAVAAFVLFLLLGVAAILQQER